MKRHQNNIKHIKILDNERIMKKCAYQQFGHFQFSGKVVKNFEMDQRVTGCIQLETMHYLKHTLLGYLIL